MYDFLRFNSIREGLIFIAINSVILAITLYYEYRRKQLEKKHRHMKSLIYGIEKYTNHK